MSSKREKASAYYYCRSERPLLLDSTVVFHHNKTVRSILKVYPDGSRLLKVFKQRVNPLAHCPKRVLQTDALKRLSTLNVDDYYVPDSVLKFLSLAPDISVDVPSSIIASKKNIESRDKRAIATICDIARSNYWNYFVTFTLNPEKVDRESYKEALSKVTKWLNHRKENDCDLKYLMVSEVHKKGGYHFHALVYFSDVSILVDSGIKDGKTKKPIYNIPSFTFGFTTAIECDDSPKLWLYLSKYVTKGVRNTCKTLGRHRYYASKNCNRPERYVFYDPVEPLSDMVEMWNNGVSIGYESPAYIPVEMEGKGNENKD